MGKIKNHDRLVFAGMVDADKPDYIIKGALPFRQLSIPRHIDLSGNDLYYWDDPEEDYERDLTSDTGALDSFVRIRTHEDILRFAKRYGPLGLCKHGYPPMHRNQNGERRWCPPCGLEPMKRWLYYIDLAKKCLNFAAAMKADPEKVLAKGVGKMLVRDIINEWLGDAGLSMELNWDNKEPFLALTGGNVFGVLGAQLLCAVTITNLSVCSGCGMPYLREGRKPQAGRRNFCKSCGHKMADKLRKREQRVRQKGVI